MNAEDREMLMEFVVEAKEHLADIESDILEMERQGADADPELVNRVFRAIHTVKGASGFFGLQTISTLSHTMENILMRVRDGEMVVTSEVADALLSGADKLKIMIDDIENSMEYDISEELAQLEAIAEGSVPKDAAEAKAEAAPTPEEPSSEETEAEGAKEFPDTITITPELQKKVNESASRVYKIKLDFQTVAKAVEEQGYENLEALLNTFGSVLASTFDPAEITPDTDKTGEGEILYETIFTEKELLAFTLKVDESALEEIPKKEIPEETAAEEKPKEEAKPAETEKKEAKEPQKAAPLPKAPTKKPAAAKKDKSSKPKQETVRLDVSLLDRLMNLAGELVLCRNQLLQYLANEEISVLHTLSQRVTELQENVMQTRMQPVGTVFNKFPRIVRDLSKKVNKQINLIIEGSEVELDRSIIEVISDPLTHLIRNSIDHGIEPPKERIAAGKDPVGTIWLRAYHEGGQVNIEIEDDGRGIDPEKVKQKAIEKGIITPEQAAEMGDQEAINLIFKPGFSTAEEVTDISGRGVGMDVVKTNFEKFGGTIDIRSEVGKGTTVTVKLPLTLAIIPSLIANVEGFRFAVPQVNLEEVVLAETGGEGKMCIERVRDHEVLRLRGKLLPLVRLADLLGIPRTFIHPETGERMIDRRKRLADRRSAPMGDYDAQQQNLSQEEEARKKKDRRKPQSFTIMVVKVGFNRYGIIVDAVEDTQEIVVKPLSSFIKQIPTFSGATILGDGTVCMILDVPRMANYANLRFASIEDAARMEDIARRRREMVEKQYLLIFNNHHEEYFSLPLALVARIDKIKTSDIERVRDQEFIQLRGKSCRLIRLENYLDVSMPEEVDQENLFVIVPRKGDGVVGIVATRIVDVLESELHIDEESMKMDCVLGSQIIDGKMTIFIDLFELLARVDPEQFGQTQEVLLDREVRILFAEDTPFFRTVVRRHLESAGYKVDVVTDGIEAWEKLKAGERYDLILSDIEMPGMNGIELVQHIKKDPNLASIPVIALTALGGEEQIKAGMEAGFDAYELKLDKERLLNVVAKFVG